MFRFMILLLQAAIYIGAIATVVTFTFGGPMIVESMGFESMGLESAGAAISYGLGAIIGLFTASILFGIPIVLLSINSNLAHAVELLKTIQPSQAPGLLQAVAPTLVDHALDALESP